MIILCTHNDGGVGKTTLAIHTTGVLIDRVGRTILIDCDDQADSWQFYAGAAPKELKQEFNQDNLTVIWNKEREALKKIAKPKQYDNIVLDLDTPLQNTVQTIVQNDPNLILVPVNKSQKTKALRNLPRTLDVISDLESSCGFNPQVVIVPLGVEQERILQVVQKIEKKPSRCRVAPEMPDMQEQMQIAIYEDRKYIWQYEEHKVFYQYFSSILEY